MGVDTGRRNSALEGMAGLAEMLAWRRCLCGGDAGVAGMEWMIVVDLDEVRIHRLHPLS